MPIQGKVKSKLFLPIFNSFFKRKKIIKILIILIFLSILGTLIVFSTGLTPKNYLTVGGDNNVWGDKLEERYNNSYDTFLVSHTENGTLKKGLNLSLDNLNITNNLNVTGNATANYYFGDGSQLTGISTNLTSVNKSVATFIVAANNSLYKQGADYIADGTADEVEINYALSNLTNGGVVYLLEGTYNISSTIILNINTTLIGNGLGTFVKSNNNIIMFQLNSYSILKDIYIYGAGSGKTSNTCIYIPSNRTVVKNSWITNCGQYGIYIYGVTIARENIIANNYLWGNINDAIRVYYDSYHNTIVGNIIPSGVSTSIFLTGASTHEPRYNTIANNILSDSDEQGIKMYMADFNTMTGNVLFSHTKWGLIMETSDNNIVEGNIIKENGRHGMYIHSSSNSNLIQGNIIQNNDVSNTLTYDGISIYGDSDNNMIIGNRLQDNDRYEIWIDASTADNTLIVGNTLIGTDHVGTINNTGTNTIISNNIETSGGNILMTGNYNFTGNISLSTQYTPSAATNTCNKGTIIADDHFLYYCNSTSNWIRTNLSSW